MSKISKEEESFKYLTKSLQAQQNASKKSPDERMSGFADNLDEKNVIIRSQAGWVELNRLMNCGCGM